MARVPKFVCVCFTSLWLLCLACGSVEAAPVNETTSEQDSRLVGWRAGPKGRGTLTILINCLVTLFLCVWTTVPVNIEPEALRNKSLSRLFPQLEIKKVDQFLAKRWVRKLGWSLVSLIFPEVTVTIAMFENKTANLLKKHMLEAKGAMDKNSKEFKAWKYQWEDLALSYFVVMGGFRVALEAPEEWPGNNHPRGSTSKSSVQHNSSSDTSPPEHERVQESVPESESVISPETTEKTGAELTSTDQGTLEDIDPAFDDRDPRELAFERKFGCTLTPHGVLFLAKQEAGFRNALLPTQVRDRSKAGKLAKVIVVVQAGWMAIQVLCRTGAGLTVTVLEVHVILHVLCSLCMYFIWWDKPVDIEMQEPVPITRAQLEMLQHPARENLTNPFYVKARNDTESQNEDTEQSMTKNHADGYLITRSGLGKLLYIQLCDRKRFPREYFDIMSMFVGRLIDSRRRIWKEALALVLIALAYGGAHLSTWNNTFPTTFELWMWRSGSILTAASLGLFVLSLYFGAFLRNLSNDMVNKYYRLFCGFFFGLGIIPVLFARIFLLVECFIALRRVPENTYGTVQWSETWPHFG